MFAGQIHILYYDILGKKALLVSDHPMLILGKSE